MTKTWCPQFRLNILQDGLPNHNQDEPLPCWVKMSHSLAESRWATPLHSQNEPPTSLAKMSHSLAESRWATPLHSQDEPPTSWAKMSHSLPESHLSLPPVQRVCIIRCNLTNFFSGTRRVCKLWKFPKGIWNNWTALSIESWTEVNNLVKQFL